MQTFYVLASQRRGKSESTLSYFHMPGKARVEARHLCEQEGLVPGPWVERSRNEASMDAEGVTFYVRKAQIR
jgi:hypothetical protein